MKVEIYTKDHCIWCDRAKGLLNAHSIDFEEFDSVTNITSAMQNNIVSVRNEVSNNICFDWELGEKKTQKMH